MEFNLNYKVRVRLTDHGRKLHREDHERFWMSVDRLDMARDYHPPVEDADGWSEFQLWVLMNTFGQFMGMALPPVMNMTIQIPENQT